ncbi:hypothetical protein [Myxococcus qinghaiensis]|uniref:hypothetical protein n=1 Tax=Myxococcus qinghaiensis TaxID=2906758 RepID=UPI0020A762C6|nr:hypothetical protein [Myxococcus qinghaiensis]MCP3168885.1 hypothetical protein [Myxococcus qinghaiensis]
MSPSPRSKPGLRPEEAIAITGLGMVSALGSDVISSCAAARAGLTRWSELDLVISDEDTLEPVPLKGHEVTSLCWGFQGYARWLRLADAALRDLLDYSGLERDTAEGTGIHVQLPGDWMQEVHLQGSLIDQFPEKERPQVHEDLVAERAEWRAHVTRRLIPELLSLSAFPIAPSHRAYTFGGAATFTSALLSATAAIQSRAVDRCIVGGIDSWVDEEALRCAFELGLLRTPNRAVGRYPGEAAAFILLERASAARSRGARIEGFLGQVASHSEGGHRFSGKSSTGLALFEAISACFPAGAPAQGDIGLSIVNLNGDEPRAREYGHTLVRLQASGLPTPDQRWYVPASFGELGAATGAAAVCLGVRGFARRYARSARILVALLDDEPSRGAFVLSDIP